MLTGIHPLLSGELLRHLDEMGHGDELVLADAHFPAFSLGRHTLVLPGVTTPELLAAIRTVVPLDEHAPHPLRLMATADGIVNEVQRELAAAAGASFEGVERGPRTADGTQLGPVGFLDRFAFYDAAASAHLVVRTGETRQYGNAMLGKGVVRA